jgi:drug efflux transport system permease protein
MSIHRLWTIIHKELRHIFRDKRILFLVTLSPAIMLLTFSYLFALEIQQTRLGVWDADHTPLSRQFISTLAADGKFVVVTTLSDYDSLREALRRGQIHLGLVIPPNFEAKLVAGERAPVQAIADGSDAITVSRSLGSLRERMTAFNQQFAQGDSALGATISVQAQAWYNPTLDNMLAMVPGLIPIVMILPSLAIALALTREKELGSFETLITAPIQPLEYLLGKLIPYILYGLISAALAMLLAIVWFQVPLRGGALDLGLLTLCYLFASLGESLFICSFLSSQGTAMRIILVIFFIPSFFLAGVIMPVDTQAGVGQAASFLLPASYYVQITRGVFLKGLDLAQLALPALHLFALGAVPFLLSVLTFKKQVD